MHLQGIAAARNGAADARGHAALAHEPADREPPVHRAAGRVEIDRKLALAQPVEQRAQAHGRLPIDRSFRDDPLATAGTAGVGLALGHIEDHGQPHLTGRRLLGLRRGGRGHHGSRNRGGDESRN